MTEQERRTWLLSVSERDSFDLPMSDWYDRCRYLRHIEAEAHLKRVGYTGVVPENKIEPRYCNEPTRAFRDWGPK